VILTGLPLIQISPCQRPGQTPNRHCTVSVHGIVPLMAVGKNITLAALDQFSHRLSTLDEAQEQQAFYGLPAPWRCRVQWRRGNR
jgi:hypothetical protein